MSKQEQAAGSKEPASAVEVRETCAVVARSAAPLLAWTVLLWVACGSAPPVRTLAPSQPWSDSLNDVFDDGFDFVSPLRSILGTGWFDEYAAQLERRLGESDVVAVVELRMISPAEEGRSFGGIDVEVLESLLGEAGPGDVLRLDVARGTSAEERIETEEARIREIGRFVAYVRLYADEMGTTRSHWHLSPDDSDLRNTIRRVTGPAPP